MFVEAILEALPELLFGDSFLALTGSKMVSDMSFCTGRQQAEVLAILDRAEKLLEPLGIGRDDLEVIIDRKLGL